jgi:hypothetical protein
VQFMEVVADCRMQRRLIILDHQHVLAAALHDLLGDFFLTPHRVDGQGRLLL